jgi:polyferredoxin
MTHLQHHRRWLQSGFFLLFILAPPLDLFRLDLTLGHFILFGHAWTLGLDPVISGEASSYHATLNILVRVFAPALGVVLLFGWVSWKYGRLYCGWLCPHFSVVEIINGLLRRATGKPTIWLKHRLPEQRPNGRRLPTNATYWVLVIPAVLGFACLWALVLLTYLLPPAEIYSNVLSGSLTRNQALFLGVATFLLSIEFMFARHLFCRFGCAVGVFQSLVWMANKRALVVGYDRQRAKDCGSCAAACEDACPMRLKPRSIKRKMFTCTECGQCLQACELVQAGGPGNNGKLQTSLLQWVRNDCALDVSQRDFGVRPTVPHDCFEREYRGRYRQSERGDCATGRC